MKSNNKYSKGAYLYWHIIWTVFVIAIYVNTIFVRIRFHTYAESKMIFITFSVACALVGMLATAKNKRSASSVFWNTVSGPGLYTMIAYTPFRKTGIIVLMAIAALLIVFYTSIVLFRRIRNRNGAMRIIRRRIIKILVGSRKILCTAMLVMMVAMLGNKMINGYLIKESTQPTPKSMSLKEYLEEYRDIEILAQPEMWDRIPVGGKLWVLQTIVDIERRFLGVPNEIEVYVDDLREGLKAFYNEDEQIIVLSYDTIDSAPYDSLQSTLHELYHCYQYRLVEAYESVDDKLKNLQVYNTVRKYQEELEDYNNGFDDLYAYIRQTLEIDAREYAREAADRYLEWIDLYFINPIVGN